MNIRKSLVLSFGEAYLTAILAFVGSVVLARLLTAAEIGVFTIATVLVGVVNVIRDLGVGSYIMQEKDLTPARFQSAFAVSLTTGLTLSAATALLSPMAASFYKDANLRNVLLVLAANFALIPFGSVTLAYLRREMAFVPITIVRVASAIVHLGLSIWLAYAGFGAISLAWASLGNVATMAIGLYFVRPKTLPLRPSFSEFKRVFSFSTSVSVTNIIKEVGTGLPDLVVGKALNLAAVGLLSRANGTIDIYTRMISTAIYTVAAPTLAKEGRAGKASEFYRRLIALLTGVSLPFFAVLGVSASLVIEILYGSNWLEAIPLVSILSAPAAIASIQAFSGELLLFTGKPKQNLRLVTTVQFARLVAVLATVWWGIEAVCFGLLGAQIFAFWFTARLLKREAGVGAADFITAAKKSALVAVIAAAMPSMITFAYLTYGINKWFAALAVALGAIIGWLIGIFVTKHDISVEIRRSLPIVIDRVRTALFGKRSS